MRELSRDTVVVKSDGIIDAEIDNEIVAMNTGNGTCYGLNRVGSRIWNLLATPLQISELCARLMAEYNVGTVECENQVLDILEELRSNGLISIIEKK